MDSVSVEFDRRTAGTATKKIHRAALAYRGYRLLPCFRLAHRLNHHAWTTSRFGQLTNCRGNVWTFTEHYNLVGAEATRDGRLLVTPHHSDDPSALRLRHLYEH